MEWLLTNTQIHSTFASLGSFQGDTYVVSDDCLETLEEIHYKLSIEDQTLRTFRRAIGFGENIRNDIIPLLINAKDKRILDVTVRILVNLTVPVECLIPVETMLASDMGRHTVFELNKLLANGKEAFTDGHTTKGILDYVKGLLEAEKKLSVKHCDSINNCLILLRNILHIPEHLHKSYFNLPSSTSLQNQIVWNLFTQSVDKLLIHLMSCPQRSHWSVTMVQLVALMYKDQHVNTLQKLLNTWFEASISESSEDNESNTSLKNSSSDSSPMLTSDPTSDSSDNGGTGKEKNGEERCNAEGNPSDDTDNLQLAKLDANYSNPMVKLQSNNKHQSESKLTSSKNNAAADGKTVVVPQPMSSPTKSSDQSLSYHSQKSGHKKRGMLSPSSDLSDCGYGTQVENPESISTSSTEEYSTKPPMHKPPTTNQKQRHNAAVNKVRKGAAAPVTVQEKKDLRRKKLVKRSRSTMINMKGLLNYTPTDDDITHILKEFTVDFLLKGYGLLVQELHTQLLFDLHLQIDTSHFFWLVTYFLKFAAQLELDLEHVQTILSFDTISYLVYEALSLCEQLDMELVAGQPNASVAPDLRPTLRRLHLSVTAIREFLQAVETYKKISHLTTEDKQYLKSLQLHIASTSDLRNLFVLLMRRFNPSIQSKQYLQDLIVTNHLFLLQLDCAVKMPEFKGDFHMDDHVRHFATVDIMYCYGYLLDDFSENGEFVNDCIFTMMHHIGGDLGQVMTLFQPIILKTFSRIWETEFELCDDWSDLVEYVIHRFINTPQKSPLECLPTRNLMLSQAASQHQQSLTLLHHTSSTPPPPPPPPTPKTVAAAAATLITSSPGITIGTNKNSASSWTQDQIDMLHWYFAQSKKATDFVGEIVHQFRENESQTKSRADVVQQLYRQEIIKRDAFDELMSKEMPGFCDRLLMGAQMQSSAPNSAHDNDTLAVEIQALRDCLLLEAPKALVWLQNVLLECCYIKLNIQDGIHSNLELMQRDCRLLMEPIPFVYILKRQSVPLVAWTNEQLAASMTEPFATLLHKLGFHLAADSKKMFARIPEFWAPERLLSVVKKLGPLAKCAPLKFDLSRLHNGNEMPEEDCGNDANDEDDDMVTGSVSPCPSATAAAADLLVPTSPMSITSTTNWMKIVMQTISRSGPELFEENDCPPFSSGIEYDDRVAESKESAVLKTSNGSDESSISITALPSDAVGVNVFARVAALKQTHPEQIGGELAAVDDNQDAISGLWEMESQASDLTRMYVSDEEDRPYTMTL